MLLLAVWVQATECVNGSRSRAVYDQLLVNVVSKDLLNRWYIAGEQASLFIVLDL